MDWFVTSLRENPELAVFLTLAIAFMLGRNVLSQVLRSYPTGRVVQRSPAVCVSRHGQSHRRWRM